MLITNNTNVDIVISGSVLKPKKTEEYVEMGFNTVDIHCEIGSCVIITEYRIRSIKNFGKLVAKEGRKKDEHGMKNIIVTEVE